MSVNFTNDPDSSSNSSLSISETYCFNSTVGRYVLTAISFTYILFILPLSVFVLYLGLQQLGRKGSVFSAATMTYSDFFTYNMAVTELIGVVGYAVYYCSSYANVPVMSLIGASVGSFSSPGQAVFPILTCVEHYVAVVRPTTYRSLRQAKGVRIRNITSGCVWLISMIWVGFLNIPQNYSHSKTVLAAFMVITSITVMVFCSISVLCVLICPRPGKLGRDRVQVDQSKQRAIRTILIIMGVLWFKFSGNVFIIILRSSTLVSVICVAEGLTFVYYLPSGLVLPLLFLQRSGKLPKYKRHNGSC